jgi:ATP-dependent Clp protease ATP-binding subunit ClpA
MLGQVKSALRALRGIELTDGPAVRKTLVSLAEERLDHGGRGIRNVIDRVLVDPLARWLFDQPAPGEGHRLEGLEIVRILDHGESRPQRFELEATPRYGPNGPATR